MMNTAKKPLSFESKKKHPFGTRTIMDLFDVSPTVAIISLSVSLGIIVVAILFFIHSAPPSEITITSGPEGSSFFKNANKYADILKRSGLKVKVLTSNGSIQNLERLSDPQSHVDLGIAQAGIPTPKADELLSLGSISYQPLLIFYVGKPVELISQFSGKKIAIGPIGSGARNFALALLQANGIKEGENTPLLDWDAEEASKALLDHKIEAAFMMSESASSDIVHKLLRLKEIHLFDVKQASGYVRKIDYLNKLELPEGVIDFGLNIPPHDVSLVGPNVELVVKKDLNPALSDLIIEAATEVHSRPGVFQKRGEFPTPTEHAIRLSPEATRFYKSGKGFLYRYLPFWLASLVTRIFVVFLPMLVILLPILRSIPSFFRWKMQNKIHRRYHELLQLERELLNERSADKRVLLINDFDRIEDAVNKMKLPASFVDQYYGLRGHIDYVRQIIEKKQNLA